MKHQSNRKRKLRFVLTTIGIILIILILSFFIYINQYYRTDASAIASLEQNASINLIYEKNYLILSPKEEPLDTGLIFILVAK